MAGVVDDDPREFVENGSWGGRRARGGTKSIKKRKGGFWKKEPVPILDAVYALIEYQKDVQKICRAVLERHLDDYGSALKSTWKKDRIKDAAWPSLERWEGDCWILGVMVKWEKDYTHDLVGGTHLSASMFDSGDAGLHCFDLNVDCPNRNDSYGSYFGNFTH